MTIRKIYDDGVVKVTNIDGKPALVREYTERPPWPASQSDNMSKELFRSWAKGRIAHLKNKLDNEYLTIEKRWCIEGHIGAIEGIVEGIFRGNFSYFEDNFQNRVDRLSDGLKADAILAEGKESIDKACDAMKRFREFMGYDK